MTTLSPSAVNTFTTCPAQYEAKYVTRTIKFLQTEATLYGTRLHEAIEMRLKNYERLPKTFDWLEPMCAKVLAMQGDKHIEKAMAIDELGAAVDYYSVDAWVRCVIDLLVYNPERKRISIIDWKTGKPKQDKTQLHINLLCAVAQYPDVETISIAFVYTKTGKIDKTTYTCKDIPDIMLDIKHQTSAIIAAHDAGVFMPTPNGLCRAWCPVTTCKYHGVGRKR